MKYEEKKKLNGGLTHPLALRTVYCWDLTRGGTSNMNLEISTFRKWLTDVFCWEKCRIFLKGKFIYLGKVEKNH